MTAPTLESTSKPVCARCGAPNEVVMGILPAGRYDYVVNDPALYRVYWVRCTRLRGLGILRNLRRGARSRGHTNDPILGAH
jgi:hypothetical protein